jgi:hypothetical protein
MDILTPIVRWSTIRAILALAAEYKTNGCNYSLSKWGIKRQNIHENPTWV